MTSISSGWSWGGSRCDVCQLQGGCRCGRVAAPLRVRGVYVPAPAHGGAYNTYGAAPVACGGTDYAHAAAMLSLHAARGAHTEERSDSPPQARDVGGRAVVGRDDETVSEELPMPRFRKIPTGEGYCKHCHMIVGTWRRKLIQHAGHWERRHCHNGIDPKTEAGEPTWCPGSGSLPWDMPDNPVDPWSWDKKR